MPSDLLSPEERQQYDLVCHATKNAIWDVLGIAVYMLFLVFGRFLVLLIFVLPTLSALSQTDGTPVVLGVGAVELILFVAIGYRIVRLLQWVTYRLMSSHRTVATTPTAPSSTATSEPTVVGVV